MNIRHSVRFASILKIQFHSVISVFFENTTKFVFFQIFLENRIEFRKLQFVMKPEINLNKSEINRSQIDHSDFDQSALFLQTEIE